MITALKKKELGGGGSQKRAPQGFFGVEKQILLHLFCIHKSRSPTKYKSESSETGTVAKDNRQRKKSTAPFLGKP